MSKRTSIQVFTWAMLAALAACSHPGGDAAQAPPLAAAMAAAAPDGAGHGMAGPAAGRIVQTHAKGLFFDRASIDRETQRRAQASKPSVDRLERVQVIDTAGFGEPLPALTIEVPAGWIARGGVDWRREVECIGNTHAFDWSAASPDGLYEVSLLPKLSWQVQSAPGGVVPLNPCPAAPMVSVRDYLEQLTRSARPDARVLGYRDRPDLVAQQAAAARQSGQASPTRLRHESGELLIGYRLQGQEMRESIVASVTFSELQGTIAAWSETGIALRAPDGLLDEALLERMRRSGRYEQAWAERMTAWSAQHVERVNQRQVASIQQWHARRMNEISLAGMAARHRIRMDTIADIGRINQQIVADTGATDARIHAATIDAIQEVQPWRDPASGRAVDLPIHYAHAWQLGDGRQFMTNDGSFDPERDLGVSGHRLEPAR
ncbi:MAG TPA: hypothetical protein VMR06_03395 [Dokdonella sp.]|uniref:hypothetical protein n=1 Tax=Dokdonella sp. TaxID=2291710 RepID=UPI002BF9AAB1|nr:hypothetical protein [Dokdonella sp.]HUD41023.1 hypothetical protein [Dokdonella sp.]